MIARLLADWRVDRAPAIALAAVTAAYALGVARAWAACGRGHGVRRHQVVSFAVGTLVLALALISPLDSLSDVLFSAHMTQHVLLAVVAPPFLVLGAPVAAAIWALPRRARRPVVLSVRGNRPLRRMWWAATAPAFAWMIHAVAIWTWHLPRAYEFALRSDAAHAAEHLSFVLSACLVWWPIMRPRTARRSAYALGIMTLFATAMQTGVLGALITLSRRALYGGQSAGAAQWGLTALQDQQLAGLIMWIPGGMLYLVAICVLFVRWLDDGPRRRAGDAARRAVPALAGLCVVIAAGSLSGCTRAEARAVPGGDAARGKATIEAIGCGACHEIGGIPGARGEVGPPLTGIAQRSIIAGELANTPENMMRWIMNPQGIEPNTAMPNLGVGPRAARDITAYLYSTR